MPQTVEAVVTSRFDRCSSKEQLLLKLASVIGHEFPLKLLLMLLKHHSSSIDDQVFVEDDEEKNTVHLLQQLEKLYHSHQN